MKTKYIDIGLNLFSKQFAGQEDEIVTRAAQQGVGMIITGSSEHSSAQAAAYVKKHPAFMQRQACIRMMQKVAIN